MWSARSSARRARESARWTITGGPIANAASALRPEDVADAKRGQPEFELRDYAAARALEFLDHGTPAGFRAALPGRPEVQHNVMRGVLPGGEYGVLANEGLEIGYSIDSLDWNGTFHGLRLVARADMARWQSCCSSFRWWAT